MSLGALMPAETALKVLLRQRHLQEHRAFCREYDKIARAIDRELVGGYPSKATFYRWLSGGLSGLPHPGHCRILENMFPGWRAEALFMPWPDEPPADGIVASQTPPLAAPPIDVQSADDARPTTLAGVTAIYTSRTEFSDEMPTPRLFDAASDLAAAGLSLNLICQQYPNLKLRALLRRASVRLLFLDPDGEAIERRNREEGHEEGHLSAWSRGNINIMRRLRDELGADKLELRMYDETIRFNLMFIDQQTCVMQTYLPGLRGLDSPTFVMERSDGKSSDLYSVYDQIFTSLWETSKIL
jgi:hypothetical protein